MINIRLIILLVLLVTGCNTNNRREIEEPHSTDSDSVSSDPISICDEVSFELDEPPVQTMFVVDASDSMNEQFRWMQLSDVLAIILSRFEDEKHLFGYSVLKVDGGECSVKRDTVLDTGLNQRYQIMAIHDDVEPGGGTPLYCSIARFTDPTIAPHFNDEEMESFLVIMSDGGNSCRNHCDGSDSRFLPDWATDPDAYTKLAGQLLRNNIYTVAIQFGERVKALDELTEAGGSSFTEALSADDEISLLEAFETAIKSARSCKVNVDPEAIKNLPELVNFYLDEERIPFDDGCKENKGWTWTADDYSQAKLCDEMCFELRANPESVLKATFGCEVFTI